MLLRSEMGSFVLPFILNFRERFSPTFSPSHPVLRYPVFPVPISFSFPPIPPVPPIHFLFPGILPPNSGVGSTRGTIQLCHEAARAGADFAIVIPSGYYAGALPKAALKKFFLDVAKESPLPVMIYNCESRRVC